MMTFQDSKLWCEEQCQALLQGAHFKAQFDWCAFGGNTKRSSIIVASSPAFKRMNEAGICAPKFLRLCTSIIFFVCIVLMEHSGLL